MSRASQVTLASTLAGAIGIVIFVHYSQRAEKAVSHPSALFPVLFTPFPVLFTLFPVLFTLLSTCDGLRWKTQAMHAGVVRDYEQQRLKRERQADCEMQRALEEEYRKVQTVSDGRGPATQQGGGGPDS